MGTAFECTAIMKRILVALDGTENSTFVLTRAVELAQAVGAKIRLLSAVQTPPIVPAPMGPIYVDPTRGVATVAETLRECERDVPPEQRDGLLVEIGTPYEVICSVARSYDADLVVIGAHRHGMLARMLGTTAAKVVNHIDRPVIVVRPMLSELEAGSPAPDASTTPVPTTPRKHDQHPLLETTTFAGAATGAAIGAAAGPVGAVVGGVVGVGMGMLAGSAIEDRADHAKGSKRETLDGIASRRDPR